MVHDGAGAPTVRLRWVFTSQPFLPVGTGSVINNRKLNEDQSTLLTVGQLPPALSNYAQDARWRLPAGMRPGHSCNPQWFDKGEPWPNDLPPTVTGLFWIPECCGLLQDPTAGGFQLGGSIYDAKHFVEPTAGGFQLGGSVAERVRYTDPAAGGLVMGGAVADALAFVDATSGGLVMGGAVADAHHFPEATSGGLELGGAAGELVAYTDPTSGGLELGGAAGELVAYTDPTSGGLELGGAVPEVVPYVEPTSGGFQLGGSVAELVAYTDPTSGGSVLGGSAGELVAYTDPTSGGFKLGGNDSETFTPTPTPGTTCATAALLTMGVTYNFSTAFGGGTSQWMRWNGAPATRTITTTALSGPTLTTTAMTGSTCGTLSPATPITASPTTFATDASGNVWIKVVNGAVGVHSYTIKVT